MDFWRHYGFCFSWLISLQANPLLNSWHGQRTTTSLLCAIALHTAGQEGLPKQVFFESLFFFFFIPLSSLLKSVLLLHSPLGKTSCGVAGELVSKKDWWLTERCFLVYFTWFLFTCVQGTWGCVWGLKGRGRTSSAGWFYFMSATVSSNSAFGHFNQNQWLHILLTGTPFPKPFAKSSFWC